MEAPFSPYMDHEWDFTWPGHPVLKWYIARNEMTRSWYGAILPIMKDISNIPPNFQFDLALKAICNDEGWRQVPYYWLCCRNTKYGFIRFAQENVLLWREFCGAKKGVAFYDYCWAWIMILNGYHKGLGGKPFISADRNNLVVRVNQALKHKFDAALLHKVFLSELPAWRFYGGRQLDWFFLGADSYENPST